MSQTANPQTTEVAKPERVGYKDFIGNLSYKTNEEQLKQAFASCGEVLSVNIITRGSRSLGYGFVEFGTEDAARNAVTVMNKKPIDGREINVELANPRAEGDARKPQVRRGGYRGGGYRGGGGGGARGYPAGGRGGRGGRGAGYGGRSFRGRPGPGFRGGFPRGGRGRGGRGSFSPKGSSGGPVAGYNNRRPRQAPRLPAPERQPSKTTLFVANLPFSVTDADLQELFKDFKIKSAHVVKQRRSERSKGFGFVELENEADQQKAMDAVNKKSIGGRELTVRVALTAPEKPAEGENSTAETKTN